VAFGVAGVLQAAPAQASVAPIAPAFFGVHHQGLHADGPIGFPQTTVGSVRMWDNKVSWRELETSPGVFDWSLIDAQMAKARANGASVLLVLGQTPRFHSTRPDTPSTSTYGAGASAMPRKAAWVRYVREVALRNRTVWGGIASFQVWNESNVSAYWSGTPQQMATLTQWTDAALRSADASAQLVAPAMVTRLISQRAWINAFYSQRVSGRNVSSYVDALSFQLYPAANGSPESSMALLRAVRVVLARHRVTKPIWNTEVNYGLVGGPGAGAEARPVPTSRQVSNVVRTYVLNAQNRVARVYWYSFDLLRMSDTALVAPDRVTLTAAGRAFTTTRLWLLGTRPSGCSTDRAGTYTCVFRSGSQVRRVVWNPRKRVAVRAPKGTTALSTSDGATRPARAGTRVYVGQVPILFRGSR